MIQAEGTQRKGSCGETACCGLHLKARGSEAWWRESPMEGTGERDGSPISWNELLVWSLPPNCNESSWPTYFHALFFMHTRLNFIKTTIALGSGFQSFVLFWSYFNHMLFISPIPPHPKISPEKDGDLKTQVEKLWREVNALKEMQALQTGKTHLINASSPRGWGKVVHVKF